jgi:hypothetical protein
MDSKRKEIDTLTQVEKANTGMYTISDLVRSFRSVLRE